MYQLNFQTPFSITTLLQSNQDLKPVATDTSLVEALEMEDENVLKVATCFASLDEASEGLKVLLGLKEGEKVLMNACSVSSLPSTPSSWIRTWTKKS